MHRLTVLILLAVSACYWPAPADDAAGPGAEPETVTPSEPETPADPPRDDPSGDGTTPTTGDGDPVVVVAEDEKAPTTTQAARFLVQASFGGSAADIAEVQALGFEGWLEAQLAMPYRPLTARLAQIEGYDRDTLTDLFWEGAIDGEDQLRRRVAYALSQIVVVSVADPEIRKRPAAFASYLEAIERNALGSYEDLIREVTFSTGMGLYLSHLGNAKGDPEAGTAPDENYARELMQLFTMGVAGEGGADTYTQEDVEALAAILTGLSYDVGDWEDRKAKPEEQLLAMASYPERHAQETVTLLGRMVVPSRDPRDTIDQALGIVLRHPAVAPFVSRQMIQKLVTANPSDAYVARVAAAYGAGRYALRGGGAVGTGRRGDLGAVVAAVLLDEEARSEAAASDPGFGKAREPVLRFAQWARAFRAPRRTTFAGAPATSGRLVDAEQLAILGQRPYRPDSVFGFYRPGFVESGSRTAAAGLVSPEMQVNTTASLPGYLDFMAAAISQKWDGVSWEVDYADEIGVAHDADALIDLLDARLTYGTLSARGRARIAEAMSYLTEDTPRIADWRHSRVRTAIQMVVTSPEYMSQR